MNKILYHCYSILTILKFILVKAIFEPKIANNSIKNKVIYIYPFAITYDGRIQKSVDALLKKGYYVELIKPENIKNDNLASWHDNLSITKLGLAGSYSFFPYIIDWKVINYLCRSEAISFYCRDIFTGIMGILAGKYSGKQVIVDFYEWYSETNDYDFKNMVSKLKPLWKKRLFKFYERYICKHANRLITNNLSFLTGISQGIDCLNKFTIIRNIPDQVIIDQNLNLRNYIPKHLHNKKILYYVGQLSFDRKLDTIILGMRNLDNCILIIQGSGHIEMQKKYSNCIKELKNQEQVLFLPPITHKEIISYASTAHVGIFICDSFDNKMYHALPNKLFEYVYAEIPQVSCFGIEVEKIINKEKIGLLFDAYNSDSFSKAVLEVLNEVNYSRIKQTILDYKKHLLSTGNDFVKI